MEEEEGLDFYDCIFSLKLWFLFVLFDLLIEAVPVKNIMMTWFSSFKNPLCLMTPSSLWNAIYIQFETLNDGDSTWMGNKWPSWPINLNQSTIIEVRGGDSLKLFGFKPRLNYQGFHPCPHGVPIIALLSVIFLLMYFPFFSFSSTSPRDYRKGGYFSIKWLKL